MKKRSHPMIAVNDILLSSALRRTADVYHTMEELRAKSSRFSNLELKTVVVVVGTNHDEPFVNPD